ncbi:MAG: hypothetical protein HOB49_26280 [Gemmatimonadetes bacterium]|nr:hypothetical protein [Gemmatimonadota bacterium]
MIPASLWLWSMRLAVFAAATGHAADLPIAADASNDFYTSRGITFYAPFDGTLHAAYAGGRAEAIEPYFEPFYKDQQIAYEEGPFGEAVTGNLCLVYDPLRNFSAERGAVSFWFRPNEGDLWTFFQVHAREAGVGPNSRRQMDLYYATFLLGTSPVLREGFARALIRPALEAQDEPFSLPDLNPDTWHHVVWTWDHTQGMRLFIDGEKLVDSWGTTAWIQMMTPGIIKLKSMQAVDELLLFDRALTSAQAIALHRGELPAPDAVRISATTRQIPQALENDVDHAYGLDAGSAYPVLRAGHPMTITPLHALDARDARQPMWRALDGNRTTCWPTSHIEIANSDRLSIDYGGPVRANYLRVLSDGTRFSVHTGDGRSLWTDEVRPERDGWEDKLVRRRMLAEPVEFEKLVLDRHGARVGEFWAYDLRQGAAISADTQRVLRPGRFTDLRDVEWEGGVYSLYHSGGSPAVEMVDEPTEKLKAIELSPLRPLHLISEAMHARTGISGVRLQLAMIPPANRSEGVLRIRIVDPVTKERDLFNADVKVEFTDGQNPQVFDLSIDFRDIVLEEGRRLWIWIVPRHGEWIELNDSKLTLHEVVVEKAAQQFVADARDLVERAFPFDSEPHPWTRSWKWPGDEHYYYLWSEWAPLEHLIRTGLGAHDPVVGTYWHILRPDTRERLADYVDYSRSAPLRSLPYTRPPLPQMENPTDAPAWALYQRELLEQFLSIVEWWYDHRLDVETGILRGYGDDTQLTGETFWMYFCTGDEKIRHLLRAVTDGTWKNAGFYRGYPMRTNDVGHNAEEVVGAWPLLVLSEYGDPRYVEMSMESVSVLDFATTQTPLGHRHFKSWYFSATEAVTDGDLGIDNMGNSAFTILGHMLSWYNRDPKLTSFYREWADSWLDDFARSREQGFTKPISVRIPAEEYVEGVYHRSYTMPHQFFITGLLSGDSTYTARALSNEDGFYPALRRRGSSMLLRDFASQRHRLLEDARFAAFRERPTTAFETWFVTGDSAPLADYYRKKVEDYKQGTHYLYTQGQPSTDRLWGLWDENLFLAYLGGYAAGHRRTSNWPGLAISYTEAGTDLASLVLENRTTQLALRAYNFEPAREQVEIRVWQLEPGEYRLENGADANEDGVFDGETEIRSIAVRRGTRMTVPIPYGQMQLLRLRQVEARPEPALLPDLAIGPDDVSYRQQEEGGVVHVTVHNIGSRRAGESTLRLLDRRDNAIAQTDLPALDAPVNLRPSVVSLRVPLSYEDWQRVHRVAVTPHRSALEITQENNQLRIGHE